MNRFRPEYSLIVLFPLVASLVAALLAGIPVFAHKLGMFQLALAAGLLTGIIALFHKYLPATSLWYAVLGLPILMAFAIYMLIPASISIFALVLPSLAFSLATLALVKYLYYAKSLIRLRTLLMGIGGALILSGYWAAVYKLEGSDLPLGFWNETLLNSMIIYVFIAFSLSVADLIILQIEVKSLKAEAKTEDD